MPNYENKIETASMKLQVCSMKIETASITSTVKVETATMLNYKNRNGKYA